MNIKALLDEQRKILHDRITELTRFNDESERSNFILDVMKDLPYPEYDTSRLGIGDLFVFEGHEGAIRQIYLKNGSYVVELHFLSEVEVFGEIVSSIELEASELTKNSNANP